jgi:hypothetical protein
MGGYLHGTRLLNLEEMAEIWWVSPHICSWVRQKKLIPTRICTRLLFALPECERFLRSMEQCKVTPASVTRAQQENEGYLASHVLHNYSTRGQLKSNRNKEIREAQWHAVVCSSERLRVHPVLQELRLSGLLDTDLSNPLLAERADLGYNKRDCHLRFCRDPLNKILLQTRPHWDREEFRASVRRAFSKTLLALSNTSIRTEVYASENEEKSVYHTCKSSACASCGYRATTQWQRERWAALPDVPYKEITFTIPPLHGRENRSQGLFLNALADAQPTTVLEHQLQSGRHVHTVFTDEGETGCSVLNTRLVPGS